MLNAIKGRWEFPQLKEKALEQYRAWSPECLLIEKKAAGAPLIQELRQMDMIVEEYSPSRSSAGVSNDKRARVNAVSPLFFDKVVWAPEQRWAMDVINECAEFPNGENDDFVDCCIEGTQILMADGTTRAIEHVQEGDFVHTPKGARRVQISVCTGIHATIRLKTTQGHTIEATPNHPIATTRGWVRLTDVRTTDTIKITSVKEPIWHSLEKKTSCVKQWFLTATRTTVIQNHRAVRTANISCVLVDANFYIAPFGSTTEDRKGKCSTAMREHLASIRDKAAAWHSSADGRRWHSEVSSKNFRAGGAGYLARAAAWENRKKNPYQFVCEMCKTPFTALVRTARFCSQTCVCRNYRANKRKAESI
jgi:predicted phage terminase large subunit-like protein